MQSDLQDPPCPRLPRLLQKNEQEVRDGTVEVVVLRSLATTILVTTSRSSLLARQYGHLSGAPVHVLR